MKIDPQGFRQVWRRTLPAAVTLVCACLTLTIAAAQPEAPDPDPVVVPDVPEPSKAPPSIPPIDAPAPPGDSIYAKEITIDRHGVTILDREGRLYSLAAEDTSMVRRGILRPLIIASRCAAQKVSYVFDFSCLLHCINTP